MPDLRLQKLPNRVPVKLAITVQPDLALALREYAAVYQAAYGRVETVEELIPFMLSDFLDSDKAFAKARREVSLPRVPEETVRRRGRRRAGAAGDGPGGS
jgi:hypothetical protein